MKRSADYYTKMAKKTGYPARSVFKLKEIQDRFHIIRSKDRILDIGASPGSWSLFCLEKNAGSLVAVDLNEPELHLKQKADYMFIKGDIFNPDIERKCLELGPYNLVLSDAAPATSGNSIVDVQASLEIACKALRIASLSLVKGGNLVIKVFQGGEEGDLLKNMRTFFERARAFKPKTSRKASKEIFFLGFSFKSRKKVAYHS